MQFHAILLFIALMVACKPNTKDPVIIPENQAPAALGIYGDTITSDGALSVSDVLVNLKQNDSIMCSVSGYVTSVCQVKGCWMVLSQNPTDSTGLFVKFTDYAFFVPFDLSGSKVVVKGKAFKEVTSVDDLRHYAEDEGKSKKEVAAITTPKEEMKFMADGVLVTEKNK